MEGGDLSNSVAPRTLFVWDGLLAHLEHERTFRVMLKTRRSRQAFDCWEPDEHYEAVVRDYTVHQDIRVDVVTHQFMLVPHIEARYDALNLGVSHVFAMTENALARAVSSSMHDVINVFFPSRGAFSTTYGPKGSPIVVRRDTT